MVAIEFDNVTFGYDETANALEDLSLSFTEGSFTCVLGANGSGKSTLARLASALALPQSGTVRVFGNGTRDDAARYDIRKMVGMVFQNPDDQIVASIVEDDVAFGLENLGVDPALIRDRVDTALEQVGLQGFALREVDTLSGGQKQLLAVAGALAMQPRILVLDEADSMLDGRGRAELMRLCRKLHKDGLAIVFITHFVEEAALADRVIVLHDGKVAVDGAPADVLVDAERLASAKIDAPFSVRLSHLLQQRGVPVKDYVALSDLEAALRELREQRKLRGLQEQRELRGNPGTRSASHPCDPDINSAPHACDPGTSSASHAHDPGASSPPHACKPDISSAPHASKPLPYGISSAVHAHDPFPHGTNPVIEFSHVAFSYEDAANHKKKRGRAIGGIISQNDQTAQGKRRLWGKRALDEPTALTLDDISFCVGEREIVGIAGHTGSGKSTLVQLCNGLLRPAQGCITVCGKRITELSSTAAVRRQVGIVFQFPEQQLFAASVYDDVAFGPRNLGLDEDEVRKRVVWAMTCMQLDSAQLEDRSPFSLSGGEQRRVAIAGVVAMKPALLVLDEPTAGLDPQAKQLCAKLIADLRRDHGMSIVVVSHDMNAIGQSCDWLVVLERGQIAVQGIPAQLFADEDRTARLGLGTPEATHLVHALGLRGFDTTGPNESELADAIAAICRM